LRHLLARRDARRLIAGQALSMFGDSAMFLVLGIWAKELTGSNAAAGLVFFVLILGTLVAPLTGLVVDRVRRLPLIVGGSAAMAAVVLLLLLVDDRGDLWLIYTVAAAYGVGLALLGAARSALIKVMFPEELLAEANAALATVREGLRLLSPLAGAGLYAAFGGHIVAVLDAATFVLAAALLATLRVDEPKHLGWENRLRTEFLAGIRHILGSPALRQVVTTGAVAFLVVGFAESAIFAVVDEGLDRPAAFLGVLEACQGAGAIVGGLTAARVLRRLGDIQATGIGLVVFGVGELGFVVPSEPVVGAGFAVAGVGISWAIVGWLTSVQRRTPVHVLGRVQSAADTVISTPQSISIALGAGLITIVDFRVLVLVMAAVLGACGLYLAVRREDVAVQAVVEHEPA